MRVKEQKVETNVSKLHRKSVPVDLNNAVECSKLNSMLTTFYNSRDGKMQGLAAIQLGEEKCAILLRFKKGSDPIVVYNPKVLLKIGVWPSIEGCLSEVGKWRVYRPLLVIAKFYNYTKGKYQIRIFLRKKSRIFMHEFDHLDGILLRDKGYDVTSFIK